MIKHLPNNLIRFLKNLKKDNIDLDEQMKWDLCKIKIREICVQYSKRKKRSQKNRYLKLQDLDKPDAALAADP